MLRNIQILIHDWIETATQLGRQIPKPKGKFLFA